MGPKSSEVARPALSDVIGSFAEAYFPFPFPGLVRVSDNPFEACPQCLIRGAFDSSSDSDESETQTVASATAAAGDDDLGR